MSDQLPRTISQWEQAAKRKSIDVAQSLTAGEVFVSGSKFQFEHFLRLRVLYDQSLRPKELPKSSWFPLENLEKVTHILQDEPGTRYLKEFLKNTSAIEEDWDMEKVKKSDRFAVAMENLHLIATRKVRKMDKEKDDIEIKIAMSPKKTPAIDQSGSRCRSLSDPIAATPPPQKRPPIDYYQSPASSFNTSALSNALTESEDVQVGYDLRRAEADWERSNFSPGDEQTVNATLVALLMALSWSLEFTGRVHHDRAVFRIPSADKNADLYKAAVDGLILYPGKAKHCAFMEVKGDYRGENQAVRRQIAAQMAAFIYHQDVVLARKEADPQTEEAKKGKKKQAAIKGKQATKK